MVRTLPNSGDSAIRSGDLDFLLLRIVTVVMEVSPLVTAKLVSMPAMAGTVTANESADSLT
jgi:hypothetical protein